MLGGLSLKTAWGLFGIELKTYHVSKEISIGETLVHTMLISLLLLLNVNILVALNTLRPRRNGQQFPDDIFKRVKMFEFQLKFHWSMFAKGPINNIPALVHIMAWHLDGTKALFEPMMVTLQMHISVTQPHCVNSVKYRDWNVPLPIDLGQLELPVRILGLCPANERRCYFIATSLIGWALEV